MTRKSDPASLHAAVRGMRSPIKPTEAQQAWNNVGADGMRKDGLSRKQQLAASQRRFIYDGSLAPTCLSCGGLRENPRLSKCDTCQAKS